MEGLKITSFGIIVVSLDVGIFYVLVFNAI